MPVCPVASKTGHTDSSHEDAIRGRIVQPQPQTRRVQVHITQNEAILFVVLSRPDRHLDSKDLMLLMLLLWWMSLVPKTNEVPGKTI